MTCEWVWVGIFVFLSLDVWRLAGWLAWKAQSTVMYHCVGGVDMKIRTPNMLLHLCTCMFPVYAASDVDGVSVDDWRQDDEWVLGGCFFWVFFFCGRKEKCKGNVLGSLLRKISVSLVFLSPRL